MTDHTTLIVGTGIAGVSAAAAMRLAGHTGSITLVGDEPHVPYRRPPVSKEILRGDKTADEIRIKKPEWFEAQNIALRTGVRAEALDTTGRKVTLDDGDVLGYDQLLLATGGSARNPWPGQRISTLRGLDDVAAIKQRLDAREPVVMVGAGLVGSEIASSAREFGCEVTLLESASRPLARLLPPQLSDYIEGVHRAGGTTVHTGVDVVSVTEDEHAVQVTAADGRVFEAAHVVVAIGMEPNVALAQAAGITVASPAEGGGIVVDAWGRTSADGVFAAGDVALQPHPLLGGMHRVEHWQGAQNHGTAVGKILAGGDQSFAEVPWCWSDQYGINIQVTGWPDAGHQVMLDGSLAQNDFIAYLLDDGVIRAAISVGRPREIRTARTQIAAGQRLA
jgi:3-phenylpropionate/trans-cinnamate dioxygenase ferredoxin reductase subunit